MNIIARIQKLEAATAGFHEQEPTQRWDFSHVSDDQVVRVSELLRRGVQNLSPDEMAEVEDVFDNAIILPLAGPAKDTNEQW
jgi:hypothetical protein